VIGSLLALSLAQYALSYVLVSRGVVQFYSGVEHAALFGYCVLCYASCRGCDRAFGPRRWSALIASYPIAAAGTAALFVAIRALLGGTTSWGMIAANLLPTLLMFHSVIAGTYFAVRHIDAVAARSVAERAAARAELRRLQHQIDPHFLFNNLNILAALIRQAPEDAERFTHHLARLYRYLMQHHQVDWVELDDEIAFVESYLHLLSARFGQAYRATLALPRGSRHFVVPGVLQELLGNVVKHNHASAEAPVEVELRIDGDTLISDSSLRPKRSTDAPPGHGLSLISERYRLQAGRPIEWYAHGGRFVVKVPLVSAA
jgi:two-component sensor histidine kinase